MERVAMKKKTFAEKVFQVIDIILMLVILAAIICPILNIIAISTSSKEAILSGSVSLWPKGFHVAAYREIMGNPVFVRSLLNTVVITAVGTFLAIMVTVMVAYALTKQFLGKKIVTYYFVLTMYFSGGLIPTYLVVAMFLHLRNTYAALILPGLFSMFYIIVVRSQIDNIPRSIFESANIDGAGEYRTVFQIVLPVITPTIAAVSMFFALGFWNMWFSVLIYADDRELWTLQYFLRAVVFDKLISASDSAGGLSESSLIPEQNFQMAAIILVAAPIVCIYPFVQKYFVKGIITGSVKG